MNEHTYWQFIIQVLGDIETSVHFPFTSSITLLMYAVA